MEKIKTVAGGDFVSTDNAKTQKGDSKKAKKKNSNKKPGFFKKLGAKIKDVFSELKRVTWPTVPKIIKQTLVVIAVVLIFLVVIGAFDFGLLKLLELMRG